MNYVINTLQIRMNFLQSEVMIHLPEVHKCYVRNDWEEMIRLSEKEEYTVSVEPYTVVHKITDRLVKKLWSPTEYECYKSKDWVTLLNLLTVSDIQYFIRWKNKYQK